MSPGGNRMPVNARPFVGNVLTSDPVRYARNAAVLEAEPALGVAAPTFAWADAAFKTMNDFCSPPMPRKSANRSC